MICFNDTTLFVHNPKTAGTSLISWLQASLSGPVQVAGVHELGTHHPSLSMALGYACGRTGLSNFDRVISVIRNPLDREVSMYTYFRDVLYTSPELVQNMPDVIMRARVQKSAEMSFAQYIKCLWDEEGTVDVWNSECFYKLSEGFALESLRILRFENLKLDLANALGLPTDDLPTLNVSSRRNDTLYDAGTIEIIRRSYDWMFRDGHYTDANLFEYSL